MLDQNQKLNYLKQILDNPSSTYADSFFFEISACIDSFDLDSLNQLFLENINEEIELKTWVNNLTARIVMHEEDEKPEEIIYEYILCG